MLASMPDANAYVEQFPAPLLTLVARCVTTSSALYLGRISAVSPPPLLTLVARCVTNTIIMSTFRWL